MTYPAPRIPVSPTAVNDHGSIDFFADYDERIASGYDDVSAAARRTGALDQLTFELSRLRNAVLQGCHL